ncbi:MAG: CoA-binding protein [Flavobacteriales bacterium]
MHEPLTLVLGASPRPERYSHLAVRRLVDHGIPVVAVGLRNASIGTVPIHTDLPEGLKVDTVTLYLSMANQLQLLDRILALNPRRIIFNPGTEHPAFEKMAESRGIEVVRGCTLVMLSVGTY